jgi:hypothetical protein
MNTAPHPSPAGQDGSFCWVDLAASDAGAARHYYEQLFGWRSREQQANGGVLTRLSLDDRGVERDVGSLYQIQRLHIEAGVPSHWTPYVQVADADEAVARARALGGKVMVQPFTVPGLARIAVVLDPVGAHVGLWQPVRSIAQGGIFG